MEPKNDKNKREILVCSCCGGAAPGPQEPDFDKGFGICADCVEWMRDNLFR